MKKIFILVVLLSVGMITCFACLSKTPQVVENGDTTLTCTEAGCPVLQPEAGSVLESAPDASDAIASNGPQVVSDDNWEFTIPAPASDWYSVKANRPQEIKVVLDNSKMGCKLLLIKEATKETYSEYVLTAMRGLTSGGGKVKSATQVELNGNKFVLINATLGQVTIWMWVTEKDSYGYAFTCGGLASVDSGAGMQGLCNIIGSSLKIK